MTEPVNHPRVVRDPELAFVLSQIQNVRGILDRIEAALLKPVPQPQVRTARKSFNASRFVAWLKGQR